MKSRFARLAAIVSAIGLASCTPAEPVKATKFGAILSLTGAAAPYGEDNRRGLELALDLINKSGGVNGGPIVLDIQDSTGDAAQAVTLARRFAGDSSFVGILGPTRTGETISVARILPEIGVPMISVGSTGDWHSVAGEFNEWTFRSTRVDTYLIDPLLEAARDKFNVKTIAVISTQNDDYAVSVLPVYEKAAERLGLTFVAKEVQRAGDTDRSAQLNKIQAANPDALIINTLSSDAPAIADQARRAGIKARFIGTAGFSNPSTWALARPETLEGTLAADNFFAGSDRPAVKEFVQSYRARFNSDPPAYAAYAYDGLRLLADAVRRAGPNATRKEVRDALAETSGFAGVLGDITYRGSGDAQKSAVILTITGNKYELVR